MGEDLEGPSMVALEMGIEEEEVGIKDTSHRIWVCPVWGLHGAGRVSADPGPCGWRRTLVSSQLHEEARGCGDPVRKGGGPGNGLSAS